MVCLYVEGAAFKKPTEVADGKVNAQQLTVKRAVSGLCRFELLGEESDGRHWLSRNCSTAAASCGVPEASDAMLVGVSRYGWTISVASTREDLQNWKASWHVSDHVEWNGGKNSPFRETPSVSSDHQAVETQRWLWRAWREEKCHLRWYDGPEMTVPHGPTHISLGWWLGRTVLIGGRVGKGDQCSAGDGLKTKMLSMYVKTKAKSRQTSSMRHWNVWAALRNP